MMRLRHVIFFSALGLLNCAAFRGKAPEPMFKACPVLSWYAPSLPVQLHLDPFALEWRPIVESCMKYWNGKVGRPVFSWTGSPVLGDPLLSPQVTITASTSLVRLPNGEFAVGWTNISHDEDCKITEANTAIWVGVEPSLTRRVTCHEMGHLLGLPHSSDPFSIMAVTATDSNFELDKWSAALLLQAYGAKEKQQ